MNAQMQGSTVAVMDPKLIGISIELTAVMARVADLLKANTDALADGIVTPEECHQLALWSAVLAQTATDFSLKTSAMDKAVWG